MSGTVVRQAEMALRRGCGRVTLIQRWYRALPIGTDLIPISRMHCQQSALYPRDATNFGTVFLCHKHKDAADGVAGRQARGPTAQPPASMCAGSGLRQGALSRPSLARREVQLR